MEVTPVVISKLSPDNHFQVVAELADSPVMVQVRLTVFPAYSFVVGFCVTVTSVGQCVSL